MTFRSDARAWAVRALLAAFVLWPAVQHQLARRAEVHPWKLFGFGMYSTYFRAEPEVIVEGGVPAELEGEVAAFRRSRAILGRLAGEDRFARRILGAAPSAREVRVRVVTSRLDPESGRIVENRDEKIYRRENP